jgi:hypothetical protein
LDDDGENFMDHKSEAFALAGFMLTVNLMRLLATKGVISKDEALTTVADASRQLRSLGATNQAARTDMLDRELLNYEALFEEVDERAAQDLMTTLAETLRHILEADHEITEDVDGQELDVATPWQPDGWGEDASGAPIDEVQDEDEPTAAIEISEYGDDEEEPANQR